MIVVHESRGAGIPRIIVGYSRIIDNDRITVGGNPAGVPGGIERYHGIDDGQIALGVDPAALCDPGIAILRYGRAVDVQSRIDRCVNAGSGIGIPVCHGKVPDLRSDAIGKPNNATGAVGVYDQRRGRRAADIYVRVDRKLAAGQDNRIQRAGQGKLDRIVAGIFERQPQRLSKRQPVAGVRVGVIFIGARRDDDRIGIPEPFAGQIFIFAQRHQQRIG